MCWRLTSGRADHDASATPSRPILGEKGAISGDIRPAREKVQRYGTCRCCRRLERDIEVRETLDRSLRACEWGPSCRDERILTHYL